MKGFFAISGLLLALDGAHGAVSLSQQDVRDQAASGRKFYRNEYVVLDGHDVPNSYSYPLPQDYVRYRVVCLHVIVVTNVSC